MCCSIVGVVLNKTDLAAVYHWSGVRSFASDVSPQGFVSSLACPDFHSVCALE